MKGGSGIRQSAKPFESSYRTGISSSIFLIPTDSLVEHPLHEQIYQPREDQAFTESIRERGILEPLVVKPDRRLVISGSRRLREARRLRLPEVPCIIMDFESDSIALIEFNRQRVKVPSEVYREAQVLRTELEKEAQRRQLVGKALVTSDERLPEHLDVREEVARKLNLSTGYLTMLETVVEKGPPELVKRIDVGLETVTGGYRRIINPNVKIPRIMLGQYYSGKSYLAPTIISMMPAHKTYCEVFGGFCSVLLNKPPSSIEVYNDISRDLVNFIISLRDHPLDIVSMISLTPYSRWYFLQLVDELNSEGCSPVDVRRAAKWWALNQMNFNGLKKRPSQGDFRCDTSNNRTFAPHIPNLLYASARLRNVAIENRPYQNILEHYDGPETFFYLDPPYLGTGQALGYDMTGEEHRELVGRLSKVQGKWLLTYNDTKLVRELYRDYSIREIMAPEDAPVSNGLKKKDVFPQLLISNYEPNQNNPSS